MPEKMTFEQLEPIPSEPEEKTSNAEKEITPEKIKNLPDWEEPASYYRGVKAEDALMAIFGELKLDAHPKKSVLGSRDNASLNPDEAIYFSPSSETKTGKKFLCAIGFDPLPTAKIEDSYLKRTTFARITGPVIAKEVILRFAGKKPGQPQKKVRFFSPKDFYEWYTKNAA